VVPIDWDKDNTDAGKIDSKTLSPDHENRAHQQQPEPAENPIDLDGDEIKGTESEEDDYQSSKMDDSNPYEFEDDAIEQEVANKTKNAQEFFEELEKIKGKDTPEVG
jgi:hypothetical protein